MAERDVRHAWMKVRDPILSGHLCPACKQEEPIFLPVGKVTSARGPCPNDSAMREVRAVHLYSGKEPYGARTVSQVGIPPFDVFVGRCGAKEVQIFLEADAPDVLGPLAATPLVAHQARHEPPPP